MRVLVVGATGLIGSAVCGRLISEGHVIAATMRPGSEISPPGAERIVEIDIAASVRQTDWEPHLDGVEAVVNCAGVLQAGLRESPQRVHVDGVAALFAACEAKGVRRVIHFSAIGVDRGSVSEFSRSKLAGDEALMARDLNWVILRPSVVLGRSAFGASALLRGLAALPILPVMPDTGPLQVVQLDEVAATVSFFLAPSAPAKVAIELAGPEKLTFDQIVAAYRKWLGWKPARTMRLPAALSSGLYRIGDIAGWLGWRPAMRTTARREIVRGAVGDPAPWRELTGLPARSLSQALLAEPASVQERWFARLYFLKPAIFVVFSLFWILTGIISLGPGYDRGVDLMERAGPDFLAAPAVVAGALADIIVGLAILWRPAARAGLYGALALSLFYLIVGTVLVPELWEEPLGPMLKIWPIMALNLVALFILEER